jgi:hypothetical protein
MTSMRMGAQCRGSACTGSRREVVEYVELDETRGVVYVLSGEDHRFNTYREGFFSADDLRDRLEEIAENEWAS